MWLKNENVESVCPLNCAGEMTLRIYIYLFNIMTPKLEYNDSLAKLLQPSPGNALHSRKEEKKNNNIKRAGYFKLFLLPFSKIAAIQIKK